MHIKTSNFLKDCSQPQIQASWDSVSPGMTTRSVMSVCIPHSFYQIPFKPNMANIPRTFDLLFHRKAGQSFRLQTTTLDFDTSQLSSRQQFLWHCIIHQAHMQEQYHTICRCCQHLSCTIFSLPKGFMTDSAPFSSTL